MIEMTRRLTFSAAHADWIEGKSPEENRRIFGSHASPEPYGHNYVLDVTVQGDIETRTGILVNIKEIDAIVRSRIIDRIHRRYLPIAIPCFASQPLTLENLTRFIGENLQDAMPAPVALSSVQLAETPDKSCRWELVSNRLPAAIMTGTTFGGVELSNEHKSRPNKNKTDAAKDEETDREMDREARMLLTRGYEFAASHRLDSPRLTPEENRALFGKCNYANGHGHNYEVEVTVTGKLNPVSCRIIDPDQLDAIVHSAVIDRYDHRHLNYDLPEFAGIVPSAEMITRIIWDRLVGEIPAPARLYRVLLRETPRNIFEYYGESTEDS